MRPTSRMTPTISKPARWWTFMLAGFPVVLDLFAAGPAWLVDAVNSMSFLSHWDSIQRGVIEMRDIVFFGSLMGAWLFACTVVLDWKKSR